MLTQRFGEDFEQENVDHIMEKFKDEIEKEVQEQLKKIRR